MKDVILFYKTTEVFSFLENLIVYNMVMANSNFKETISKIKNTTVKYYKLAGLFFLKFLQKHYIIIAMVLATALALVARYFVVLHPTQDSVGYVLSWMNSIKENGFASFYKTSADYSPIFLFMIAIISLLPSGKQVTINGYTFYQNDMIYMKTVYYLVTIALAFAVYLLIKEFTSSKGKAAIGYIATLVLPTVFLNSAVWGNADVIYVTFLVYSFYFIIKDKQRLAFIFFGLAFANKLQAVFLAPFLVYLMFARKIKVHKLIYAILALFVTFLPAYFCGASFTDTFKYITEQIGGYNKLTLGCANLWQIIDISGDLFKDNVTWYSLSLIAVTLICVYYRGVDLDNKENLFKMGFFLIMITIFFLPHMHERYFYIIDVLVLVYAFIDKKKFYFVPLMQISSIIAYFHYLAGYYFIDSWGEGSVNIAAFINILILIVVAYDLIKAEHNSGFIKNLEKLDQDIQEAKENDQDNK